MGNLYQPDCFAARRRRTQHFFPVQKDHHAAKKDQKNSATTCILRNGRKTGEEKCKLNSSEARKRREMSD